MMNSELGHGHQRYSDDSNLLSNITENMCIKAVGQPAASEGRPIEACRVIHNRRLMVHISRTKRYRAPDGLWRCGENIVYSKIVPELLSALTLLVGRQKGIWPVKNLSGEVLA